MSKVKVEGDIEIHGPGLAARDGEALGAQVYIETNAGPVTFSKRMEAVEWESLGPDARRRAWVSLFTRTTETDNRFIAADKHFLRLLFERWANTVEWEILPTQMFINTDSYVETLI